jgi:RNA polymerase sigma-70 factor (ECF subfamily)
MTNHDENDDGALLEAWRAGDRAAGQALFARHFERVYRFFADKVEARSANDLVQATFTACVEGRDRIRDGSFRAYLYGVARIVLLGHYRDRKHVGVVDPHVESLLELGAGPSTLMVRQAEVRLLLAALRRIPLDLQIVLELHYWEGMNSSELGAVLDIPPATVRSRLRRARELLRARMQALDHEPALRDSTLSNLERWALSLRDQIDRPD